MTVWVLGAVVVATDSATAGPTVRATATDASAYGGTVETPVAFRVPLPPIRIEDDRGGLLSDRVAQITRLRRSGQAIEIAGECLSACTLYLGLANVCVWPAAVLGFHGPASVLPGMALPPAEFERWSQIMAAHYPPDLRRWFLQTGRRMLFGFHRISGATLIAMGVTDCTRQTEGALIS